MNRNPVNGSESGARHAGPALRRIPSRQERNITSDQYGTFPPAQARTAPARSTGPDLTGASRPVPAEPARAPSLRGSGSTPAPDRRDGRERPADPGSGTAVTGRPLPAQDPSPVILPLARRDGDPEGPAVTPAVPVWFKGDKVTAPGNLPGVITDWTYDCRKIQLGLPGGDTAHVQTAIGLLLCPAEELKAPARGDEDMTYKLYRDETACDTDDFGPPRGEYLTLAQAMVAAGMPVSAWETSPHCPDEIFTTTQGGLEVDWQIIHPGVAAEFREAFAVILAAIGGAS